VLLHPESPDTPALLEKALNYLAVSNSAWAAYQALPASDEEAALSKVVADARSALLNNAIQPMVDAMRKGDHASADRLAMVDIPPLAAALTQKTASLATSKARRVTSRRRTTTTPCWPSRCWRSRSV
jgi:methyl-accepting chemotaxis protein